MHHALCTLRLAILRRLMHGPLSEKIMNHILIQSETILMHAFPQHIILRSLDLPMSEVMITTYTLTRKSNKLNKETFKHCLSICISFGKYICKFKKYKSALVAKMNLYLYFKTPLWLHCPTIRALKPPKKVFLRPQNLYLGWARPELSQVLFDRVLLNSFRHFNGSIW